MPYQVNETIRWDVFERDNFTCQHCGIRRYLTVDHITPRSKGGDDSMENLQTLCKGCNTEKSIREYNDQVELRIAYASSGRVKALGAVDCAGEPVKVSRPSVGFPKGICGTCKRIVAASNRNGRWELYRHKTFISDQYVEQRNRERVLSTEVFVAVEARDA